MKRIRDIVLALICTIIIVGVTAYDDQSFAFENPAQILEEQLNEFEGISGEIQGVWSVNGDLAKQSAVLRGNQMIITDESNGTIYYTVDKTQMEEAFQIDGIADNDERMLYILTIDKHEFKVRYGEDAEPSDTFYFVYDTSEDNLISRPNLVYSREADEELTYIIQDELVTSQPINREQLRKVDNKYLVEQYYAHQEAGSRDIYLELYRDIAKDYPELNLLVQEDYEAYMKMSEILVENSELTFARLHQADPIKVLSLFQEASLNSDNQEAIVKEIYPSIEAEIQAYHERQLTYENSLRHVE